MKKNPRKRSASNVPHALITGANRGIGFATAKLFVASAIKVTITDIDARPLSEVAAFIKKHREWAQYFPLNVTKIKTIDGVLAKAEKKFGAITVLFNNAAVFDMAPLLESSEAMYDKLFAVNVRGMFFVMQKVLKRMVRQGIEGSVVNLASQAGRRGESLVSHYCATKAAVINYTQSAALAMASHRIRVNAISPGVIDTPMWKGVDALFAKYEKLPLGVKKKQVGEAVPLGYMGKPEQVAEAALFFASEQSNYITAQTLNVDGGSVMS